MAKLPPKKTSIKAPPHKPHKDMLADDTTSKPALGELKNIQFKVPANKHQEIKMFATSQGKTITEMFLEMFEDYKESRSMK